MAVNRFNQYKYALCGFFRKRGYNVDSKQMTITIDEAELTNKEKTRLQQLKNWGYQVINPTQRKFNYSSYDYDYSSDESFVDFADEIIAMYGGSIDY